MPIVLGVYAFDESTTAAVEHYEEVGGKDGRSIRIKGVLDGFSSAAEIEAELDAILAAASNDNPDTPLYLRPDRRLYVRRISFERQIRYDERIGAFTLALKADDPWEESAAESGVNWNVSASGATLALGTNGNRDTAPRITLLATGNVINPAISDGARTIRYKGIVPDGATLVFDGANKRVTLGGATVSWNSAGEFPRISPDGGTTFTYTASSHNASINVAHRDLWV